MLAQNFKTAADLGITDPELDALIKVLGMLERGEIPDRAFTMRQFRPTWSDRAQDIAKECGTIGCLCGWANFVSGGEAFLQAVTGRLSFPTEAIHDLFAIQRDEDDRLIPRIWRDATIESAAIALRSYLNTGKANWAEALS